MPRLYSSSDVVNIANYGAVSGADSTAAIAAACTAAAAASADVFVPNGTFLCQGITVPDGVTIRGAGWKSILKKNANGTVLTLGTSSHAEFLKIDGDGANYTGPGVTIPATVEYAGQQRLTRLAITDTDTYPVQYTGQFSGFGSAVVQSELSPRNYTTYACVKWSGLETASNQHGDRAIIGCLCNGAIVDASSSNVGYVANCFSGDNGSLGPIICDSLTGTLTVTGSRLVGPLALKGYSQTWTGNIHSSTVTVSDSTRVQIGSSLISGDLTLTGDDTIVSGCSLDDVSISGDRNIISGCRTYGGTNITLASGAEYNRIADTYVSGTLTDNSGNATNHYDIGATSFTPSWTAASVNPVLGSSTIAGRYSRRGNVVTASIKLSIVTGGAFSSGTGAYYFSLPFVPSTSLEQHGTVQVFDSGATNYLGVARTLTDGTARCQIYLDANGSAADPTNPIVWATGDTVFITITYEVG